MAVSSTESLDTSANSYPTFSFSTSPLMPNHTSFSDLLSAPDGGDGGVARPRGLSDRIADRTGSGVPKFKSITPPSLPISQPCVSPSSYFAIPPGLSPAELLDSPVLLSNCSIMPSPTTGSFPTQAFFWKSDSGNSLKQENRNFSDFTFQPQTKPTSSVSNLKTETLKSEQEAWSFQDTRKQGGLKSEMTQFQTFSPEITAIQTNNESKSDYNNYPQQAQPIKENRKSDDGYNWRKYGQKQVKGSENPRSYYKCTCPNCPTKKKVERSLDGQITEIVYKGSHNHPKPQSTRRSSSSSCSSVVTQSFQVANAPTSDNADQGLMDCVATPDNSSISMGDDDFEQSSQKSKSGGDDFEEDEPDAKRWKKESENECISAPGSRTVREPRVVVQTTSDIDILDDGYRWRKYGQKVVKGNPNPRSYYKCTNPGCPVRKHVERASQDLRAVITTYEGKHNHDVPAARGSGGHRAPLPENMNTNATTAIRPSPMVHQPNNSMTNALRNGQSPFTLEMLQNTGNYGFNGFTNPISSYMNNQSQQNDNVFSRAKEEPKDESFFESYLC